MPDPTNLYPQSEGPYWDEVPRYFPRRGQPGLHVVRRQADYLALGAYDEQGALVAVLTFGLDQNFAQPIDTIWLVTRPQARRQGWATKLYRFAAELGFEMEAASDGSLERGEMTPDGYDFMVGRRAKAGGRRARPAEKTAPRVASQGFVAGAAEARR